jgi:RHH-type transcriptional regulator, rel operon repressor / antitoxin RelB
MLSSRDAGIVPVDIQLGDFYPQVMEVQLSPEQAAQLARIAALAGRSADDLAREAVDRYLAEEARFQAAVQAGLEEADRGDFIPASEVWAAVERELNR